MSTWNHKAAYDIARALDKHLGTPSKKFQFGRQLVGIYIDAEKASKSADTSSAELNHIRQSLCRVCKEAGLYACGANEGFSPDCALIKQNQ